MANLDGEQLFSVTYARRRARMFAHVQRAQMMLVAAGLSACCIVAVAAAMLGTLL